MKNKSAFFRFVENVVSITLGSAVQSAKKASQFVNQLISLAQYWKKKGKMKVLPSGDSLQKCKEMKQSKQKQIVEVYS